MILGNGSQSAKEVSCQLKYNCGREKSHIIATFVTIDNAKNWIIGAFNQHLTLLYLCREESTSHQSDANEEGGSDEQDEMNILVI